MAKIKFTKLTVEKIPLSGKPEIFWDSTIHGFGLRSGQMGKSWICQAELRGVTVKITLGKYPEMSFDDAKLRAGNMLQRIRQGEDVRKDRKRLRERSRRLGEEWDRYAKERGLKPKTLRSMDICRRLYLNGIASRPVESISRSDIVELHRHIGELHGEASANLTLRYLRAVLNNSRLYNPDLIANPVDVLSLSRGWYKVKRRKSCIRPHELQAWWAAVELEGQDVQDYIKWLLYTGMRREEALRVRVEDISIKGRFFEVLDTKNGETLELPLPSELMEVVERRLKGGGYWLFQSLKHHADNPEPLHISEPKSALHRINERVGMSIMFHDLRRTFVTTAESLDISVYALKALVNHSTGDDVTAGYIVMSTERLREPMQRIASYISSLIKN